MNKRKVKKYRRKIGKHYNKLDFCAFPVRKKGMSSYDVVLPIIQNHNLIVTDSKNEISTNEFR